MYYTKSLALFHDSHAPKYCNSYSARRKNLAEWESETTVHDQYNSARLICCCCSQYAEQGLCKGSRSTSHLESGRPWAHSQMVQLLQSWNLLWRWSCQLCHSENSPCHLYSTELDCILHTHYHNTWSELVLQILWNLKWQISTSIMHISTL